MAGVQLGGLSINNPLALQPSAAKAPASKGTFWIGNNGNVIVSGAQGTNSAGKADANTVNYWTSRGYTNLGHAAAPRTAAATPGGQNTAATASTGGYGSGSTGAGGGGGGSGIVYPDKSNDIMVNQKGLDSVGATRDAGWGAIDSALGKIMGQYGDDLNAANTEYGHQSTENTKDLQTNKQTSLETGVQGRQGLFGTLASIGALNGTGVELANRAVQKGTNEDLTTAGNTYATNQNALDSGVAAYRRQEQRLEDNAKSAAENNKTQVQNDFFKGQQQYLKNIGDDYQAEGNTAKAKDYYSQAANLFPQIASSNVPTISLGYTGGAYTAPTLSQYVSKANNTSVQTTPGSNANGNNVFNIPGLIALNKKQGA